MAYNGQVYSGVISQVKKDYVNMDKLFNTNRKKNERTSNFLVTVEPVINQGAGAIGECGSIPIDCNDGNQFTLTANEPLSVNQKFDQCIQKVDSNYVLKVADSTAQKWAIAEATYAYGKVTPAFEDTTAVNTGLNAEDKIIQSIVAVQKNGFLPSDLIVAVSSEAYYELLKNEISCCDMGVQTAQTGQILGNKLGVKLLVHVPTSILSGGTNVSPETSIHHVVYVQDFAPFITYCEKGIVLEEVKDMGHAGFVTHLVGSQYMEAGYLTDEISGTPKTSIADGSAVKVFQAETAAPFNAEKAKK